MQVYNREFIEFMVRAGVLEVAEAFGMKTFAIVTLDDGVAHLGSTPMDGSLLIDAAMCERIDAYRHECGA